MEIAKALGGSFKFVTLAPKTKGDDSLLRGVFLANNLASNDNLTGTTKRQTTHIMKTLTIHEVFVLSVSSDWVHSIQTATK